MRRLLRHLALYAFHIAFARPVLRWVVGVRYRKRHLVPEGPCLVVANHNSHLDAAVLMTMFPLRRLAHVHPVAAADYFGSNWFMRTLAMLFMNGVPIERRPARNEDPLEPIVARLEAGQTLIFFPEGSRGEAGVVSKFRSGVGKLVQSVPGLLVVPVFMSGPERIWPRGELVPVPLSVDASIGKPRAYPALEDPRAIADLVRADVLALAPPPPPVPGERAAPPTRVAISGIDATAVHAVFLAVAERLGREGATLAVAESSVLEASPEGVREATGPLPVARERAWLGVLAALFRPGPHYRGQRFVRLVERAQINEALSQGRDTRFVVEQGSVLVDLLATARIGLVPPPAERDLRDLLRYATGEKKLPLVGSWRLLSGARPIWLFNVMNLSRATVPEILVHVTAPPRRVMEQLRSEGVELLPHQNEPTLERLQHAYHEVAELLRRRRKLRVVQLDTTTDLAGAAAERVAAICRELAAATAQASYSGDSGESGPDGLQS